MSQHPAPSTSPIRGVVADDSAFMRRMLSDALAAGGFDVVGTAANGDEALGVCTRLRPDVLTLDLAMPGLDGIGVLRALRDASSPIPVVVVSGFAFDKIVPGLELTRPQMQVVHIVHAVAAMFIIAMFIGHAYMGTIGVTGSWPAMKTGYVDEGWAEEHHPLWHDDIVAGRIPAQRSAALPPRSGEQPAA